MHVMHGAGRAGTVPSCASAQDVWSPNGPQTPRWCAAPKGVTVPGAPGDARLKRAAQHLRHWRRASARAPMLQAQPSRSAIAHGPSRRRQPGRRVADQGHELQHRLVGVALRATCRQTWVPRSCQRPPGRLGPGGMKRVNQLKRHLILTTCRSPDCQALSKRRPTL